MLPSLIFRRHMTVCAVPCYSGKWSLLVSAQGSASLSKTCMQTPPPALNWALHSEPPSPLGLVYDRGIPSPLCSLICLWLISFLPSQTGVIHRSYMILLSPQSSSQMISAIFHHLNQGSVPPSNAHYNTVRPIDLRSI